MTAAGIIAIDMDGTLLGLDGQVSRRNCLALHAAERAGFTIAIATGRRHSYAMKGLRGLGLKNSCPILSSNGAVTRTLDAKLLHRTFLDRETALWMCGLLDDYRNALVLTFDKVGEDGEDSKGALVIEEFDHLHGRIRGWMETNEPWMEIYRPIERVFDDPNAAPIQAMLCGNLQRMQEAEKLLLRHSFVRSGGATPRDWGQSPRVAIHRTEYPDRDLCLVDLMPVECSKGTALRQLCKDRGVDIAHTLAIGDNWNDVPMFEVAGYAAVMGNAAPDLQQMAYRRGWEMVGHHDNDGVADVIEQAIEHGFAKMAKRIA